MREECLREFGFADVYRQDKERENVAALEVLPDLLGDLDRLAPPQRLLALVQVRCGWGLPGWLAVCAVLLPGEHACV